MAQGIAIGEVTNKLQNVTDNVVLPVSTGGDEPEVVEASKLKEYINSPTNIAITGLEDRIQDIENGDTVLPYATTDDVPTKVSELLNDRGYTNNEGTITEIIMNGSSIGTSGSINLGNVVSDVSNKVDKIQGKGLSTNDFTYAYRIKLENLGDASNKDVDSSITNTSSTNVPTTAAVAAYAASVSRHTSTIYVGINFEGDTFNPVEVDITNYSISHLDMQVASKNIYFLILPDEAVYCKLGGMDIPMEYLSQTTYSGNTYNVYKTSNTYDGSFTLDMVLVF